MKKTILLLTLLVATTDAIYAQSYPEMIAIEGGSFKMGDNYGPDNEQPVHTVVLKNFSIAKTETTVLQWKTYCNATGHKLQEAPSGGWKDNHPVVDVSWEQAVAYCQWLSKKTGRNYQLPTEQQWEYAARGGQKKHMYVYSGGEKIDNVGWYNKNSGGTTKKVADKKANELGIYDMTGNVYEWCNDVFAEYPNGSKIRAVGVLQSEEDRVLRGGSWYTETNTCQVSSRDRLYPNRSGSMIGFRVAITEAENNKPTDEALKGYKTGEYFADIADEFNLLFGTPDMVQVEGGSFNMGSLNGEDDEKPVHKVTVNSFKIGKYEVTVRQYRIFCESVGNDMPDRVPQGGWKDEFPMGAIEYEDAIAYCTWLSNKNNKKYRLPTEAEWEYAARGGNKSVGYTYAGSNNLDEVAWNEENSGKILDSKDGKIMHPGGLKKANELGLYDMSGNAEEWCMDGYEEYKRKDQTNPNPKGDTKFKVYRITRGGDCNDEGSGCRVAARNHQDSDTNFPFTGFRIVEAE
jgi:sulfatase modifying factor 1